MNDYQDDLALMIDAAKQAGELIMGYYRPGETVSEEAGLRFKSADNPLTEADLECDRLLRTTITAARPDDGWLSEETADTPERLGKKRVWVVDPIDGTKEFIVGLPQFAISIGLVEDGQPVAACTFNPAAEGGGELFTAAKGSGAFMNGEPIRASGRADLEGATCLASRSETKRGDWAPYLDRLDVSAVGSIAYKLSLVAAGRYDLTFTLTPKSEWDFCAGHLLVTEAGGRVTTREGEPFRFNLERPKVRTILSTNGLLHDPLVEMLKDAPLGKGREG